MGTDAQGCGTAVGFDGPREKQIRVFNVIDEWAGGTAGIVFEY